MLMKIGTTVTEAVGDMVVVDTAAAVGVGVARKTRSVTRSATRMEMWTRMKIGTIIIITMMATVMVEVTVEVGDGVVRKMRNVRTWRKLTVTLTEEDGDMVTAMVTTEIV